ncbi:hypothetical protein KI387_033672, partial [Taxus chinensis]
MNNFEVSTSSSTGAGNSISPSELSFDLVIGYIDDVLSAITDKNSPPKTLDSGMKLKDMVEPMASDFSKLCEGISQGAKMFSDQTSLTKNLSSEAQSMAVDVLKGVGNAHWAAVGLLAIANVLERVDKISTNDRDCIDLLKGMLDLAKYIKMVKDINADFHREILGKMSEALHLIVSGAILCHSFIRCNKISKFLSTKKICEELVYLRGKVDRLKIDMVLQMNYMFVSSVTFQLSRQQQNTNDTGEMTQRSETEIYTIESVSACIEPLSKESGEMPKRTETKIDAITSETAHAEPLSPESDNVNLSNKKNGFVERLVRTFLAFGGYLKGTANGLRNIAAQRFDGCRKPIHTLSIRQLSSDLKDGQLSSDLKDGQLSSDLKDEQPSSIGIECFTIKELETATNWYREKLGEGGFGYTYKGTLSDGRQVVIKRSRDRSKALQRELECISSLRHPNILNIIGSCITGDELLLVYDFMPNGNLSNLLFDPAPNQVLDWPTRWRIIHALIHALVFLQEGEDHVCILHRDIKPTNVLLDGNFNAKLSDFGIARKLPQKDSSNNNKAEEGVYVDFEEDSEDAHVSTGVAGTVGYVAPEYMMTGHVTKKSDIYSFGLLLLNIVSGRRCFELPSISDGIRSLIQL